jgi:hypothetical protein
MTAEWLFAQLSLHAPGSWLLLSFTATMVVAIFGRYWTLRQRRRIHATLTLLIPYGGLLFGGLSPRLMGLVGVDWQASLSLGLGLFFALIVLLILVRAAVSLAAPSPPPAPNDVSPHTIAANWRPLATTLVESGIEELHWAFLRGAFWELFLTLPTPPGLPAYWAVWTAAALAAVEIVVQKNGWLQRLISIAILMMTSILFFYSRNFWLCWMLHLAAQLIIAPPTAYLAPDRSLASRAKASQINKPATNKPANSSVATRNNCRRSLAT